MFSLAPEAGRSPATTSSASWPRETAPPAVAGRDAAAVAQSGGLESVAFATDARDRLVSHPVYRLVNGPEPLRRFMESHVFAVWDFQSLLKALQQRLTCTAVPWLPTADPEARRLVNEIVLDEESDALPADQAAELGLTGPDGPLTSASHFELYLAGMRQAGADTGPIDRLIAGLRAGMPLEAALAACDGPPAALEFVRQTFRVIESGEAHRLAAAFTYGREDVIPDMFRHVVEALAAERPDTWGRFRFYLERHIAHDDEKHAPICRRIVARLCGDDPAKWAEAAATAHACIEARIALWDAIAAELVEPF
jgi:hypothetical protein